MYNCKYKIFYYSYALKATDMIRVYKTKSGILLEYEGNHYKSKETSWNYLVNKDNLYTVLLAECNGIAISDSEAKQALSSLQPPIGSQEVWASGVTYLRSRDARMEESENAKTAYDRVYDADRPELFFKSQPYRVSGPGDEVYIRKDSTWNVPEPELTLFINAKGEIAGYTVGNDMSSRSIEGENTLYLPQAKTYEKSAALGPCLLVLDKPIDTETGIDLKIYREGKCVFHGQTKLSAMKRKLPELRDYLVRALKFEFGAYLMTGTGIVPDSSFTLEAGDECVIGIEGIGDLRNVVKWV